MEITNLQKRYLLFLLGCITIRLLFVYISMKINIDYLPILGYLALIPAIGFAYIYMTGSRTTGPEVFGDTIWWNHLRPIHSLLYFGFAVMAIAKNNNAYIMLGIDVMLGLTSFLVKHFA